MKLNLFPPLEEAYTKEHLSAREAQHKAECIAFAPVVFQVARLMVKFGILEMLRNSSDGLTRQEIARQAHLSDYAAQVLTEASLTIGLILVDTETARFTLSKTGWFLLTDPMVRVNMDFNHDVNYEGWFRLEESLTDGRPAGLEHFGSWSTVYEGLSKLPEQVQKSWFAFDHFYSDSAFPEALAIVFDRHATRTLLDVGGNTGRWALRCVEHDPQVEVTIMDLPQQLELMRQHTDGKPGADRIYGYSIDLLDEEAPFPARHPYDAIWMSQFLDCFGETEIVSILTRAARIMQPDTRLYIMETFWDRQRFDTAAFCLTQISLYFTAIANGNSKMYHADDMRRLVDAAGLTVEHICDGLGQGHSLMICKLK
ncbi:MAG: methyltransferase domain-containing protein [Prevotellaceae bacterium]|jgi:ubiquinone/menaquinone biosynthesis C-methylase UbiE|nr:methyltransferase domain-containing protein [Prevotellaceae bacterium]